MSEVFRFYTCITHDFYFEFHLVYKKHLTVLESVQFIKYFISVARLVKTAKYF